MADPTETYRRRLDDACKALAREHTAVAWQVSAIEEMGDTPDCILVVSAPSGVGKTTLVRALAPRRGRLVAGLWSDLRAGLESVALCIAGAQPGDVLTLELDDSPLALGPVVSLLISAPLTMAVVITCHSEMASTLKRHLSEHVVVSEGLRRCVVQEAAHGA